MKKATKQVLHGIFFNPQYKCTEVPQSHISKSTPTFCFAPSF